jgi:hypothetical protein
VLDYLGIDVDYRFPGQVKISMVGMVDEALDEYELEGFAMTPAALHFLQVSEDSPTLKKGDKEKFYSMVQKLLYMSKRARPDILTAVIFLTTRVTSPNEEDERKLFRVLKYLRGSRDLALTITGSKDMIVSSYIDASYAIHPDGKGHTCRCGHHCCW